MRSFIVLVLLANVSAWSHRYPITKADLNATSTPIRTVTPVDAGCLTARITPNPVDATSQAFISSTCGTAPIFYAIQDLSGKTIKRGQINLVSEEAVLDLDEVPLVSGMYLLTLRQDQVMKRVKMVKAK